MKPKYGIIGCGNISRFHFNALNKLGADIVHIADINEKAAEPYVYFCKLSLGYLRTCLTSISYSLTHKINRILPSNRENHNLFKRLQIIKQNIVVSYVSFKLCPCFVFLFLQIILVE
jgi:hypothetical protein